MRTQLFKSCNKTPYEFMLSEPISPRIRYIWKYDAYTVMSGVCAVYGKSHVRFGQPY